MLAVKMLELSFKMILNFDNILRYQGRICTRTFSKITALLSV